MSDRDLPAPVRTLKAGALRLLSSSPMPCVNNSRQRPASRAAIYFMCVHSRPVGHRKQSSNSLLDAFPGAYHPPAGHLDDSAPCDWCAVTAQAVAHREQTVEHRSGADRAEVKVEVLTEERDRLLTERESHERKRRTQVAALRKRGRRDRSAGNYVCCV